MYNGVYTLYLYKGPLRGTAFQTVRNDYIIQCMGTVGLVMRRCYLGVVIYREWQVEQDCDIEIQIVAILQQ